jgi:hypothetical protein
VLVAPRNTANATNAAANSNMASVTVTSVDALDFVGWTLARGKFLKQCRQV